MNITDSMTGTADIDRGNERRSEPNSSNPSTKLTQVGTTPHAEN
jgi:hypothetical protein